MKKHHVTFGRKVTHLRVEDDFGATRKSYNQRKHKKATSKAAFLMYVEN